MWCRTCIGICTILMQGRRINKPKALANIKQFLILKETTVYLSRGALKTNSPTFHDTSNACPHPSHPHNNSLKVPETCVFRVM